MKLLITLLIVIIIPLSAYITTQKACCPHKNVMIFVPSPWGLLDIEIEKGLLNKENEDKYYIDSEKYDKLMEEDKIKDELKKQSEDAAKETDKALGI